MKPIVHKVCSGFSKKCCGAPYPPKNFCFTALSAPPPGD